MVDLILPFSAVCLRMWQWRNC